LRLQQAEAVYPSLPAEEKERARGFEMFLKSIAPCEVDQIVKEGDAADTAGSIMVIETPGHTAGHISLYIPETKTLIAGDAVVLEEDRLVLANPDYAFDLVQAKASAERIQHLAPSTIICYHGGICHKPDFLTYCI
jgi:glyoxylase-like metal-dependent hydrolase (beta-lactamase superfamily II)